MCMWYMICGNAFLFTSVIDFIKKKLAVPCVVRDLNSLASIQTHTLCGGSAES